MMVGGHDDDGSDESDGGSDGSSGGSDSGVSGDDNHNSKNKIKSNNISNSISNSNSNGNNCLTAWDFYHRNFTNFDHRRGIPIDSTNPDVAYIDGIINAAVDAGVVDPTRVYIGGWTNGGFFATM